METVPVSDRQPIAADYREQECICVGVRAIQSQTMGPSSPQLQSGKCVES